MRDAGIVEEDAAAGGAGDTVFVDLAGGLGPSTAKLPAESRGQILFPFT